MGIGDQRRLENLPWHVSLEEWPEHGITELAIRRGESRHPVIFVESEGMRYAIKETTPHMAEREINNLRNVSIEEAAEDWYTRYHLPTILLLRRHLTSEQDPMQAYFSIIQHKWKLSRKAGYDISLEEAVVDWAMQEADTGKLGAVDPASIATWWRERKPVTEVLEPEPIASEKLEPLLSVAEQPLVHLPAPELEEELSGLLEQQKPGDEETR